MRWSWIGSDDTPEGRRFRAILAALGLVGSLWLLWASWGQSAAGF